METIYTSYPKNKWIRINADELKMLDNVGIGLYSWHSMPHWKVYFKKKLIENWKQLELQ